MSLQWGRGLGPAESRHWRAGSAPHSSPFNGAAVLGPRRAAQTTRTAPHSFMPSMGPRSWDRGEPRGGGRAWRWGGPFNGAAVLGPRRDLRRDGERSGPGVPSMGPRSWDRGEWAQYGRDARGKKAFNGAAVLGPRRARTRTSPSVDGVTLQWGRGLGTAESVKLRRVGGEHGHPSMGPRSWDRGEFNSMIRSSCSSRPFNGAAVLGPRRGGRRRGRPREPPAFNGGAVLGPRRGPQHSGMGKW